MEGIEILNVVREESMQDHRIAGLVITGICVIMIIISIIADARSTWNNMGGVITVLACVCFPLAFGISMAVSEPVCLKAQYEVIFLDDTKVNDVLEKYRIIEQRGNIYVIEER